MAILFDGIAKKAPRRADLVMAVLRKMWKWAEDTGRATHNPARQSKRHVSKPKTRVLDDAELMRVWCSIDTSCSRQMGCAIKILILTGVRVNEMVGAKKTEIADDVWSASADGSSNKSRHAVPLAPMTKAIFSEAILASSETQIFASRNGAVSESFLPNACTKAVVRVMKNAGVDDASAHDFRRTIATRLSEVGTPDDIIERLLSHRGGRKTVTGMHYNHNDKLNEKRKALELWDRRVAMIIAGRQGPPEPWQ